jgi:two-component system sensor histidine kinase YesM
MKMSIKNKILISTSVVVTTILILSVAFANQYFSSLMKEQVVHDYRINLEQNAKQLEYIIEDISKFSHNIIVNKEIQDFLRNKHYMDRADDVFYINDVIKSLESFNHLRNYIHSSAIITTNGSVYWSMFPFEDYFQKKLREDWFLKLKRKNVKTGFSELHDIFTDGNSSTKVVSYIIDIRSIQEQNRVIGQLILNIDFGCFREFLKSGNDQFEGFALLDDKENILFYKRSEGASAYLSNIVKKLNHDRGEESYAVEKDGYIIVNEPISNGWKLVAYISSIKILDRIRYIFYFFIFFILISLFFIIIFTTPIIEGITRPIIQLTKAMKEVSSGKLDTKISISSGDEMEVLGDGFNKMTTELKEYIDKSIQNEKIKRKMEFELLFAQINPHFIYNTLNSVIYLARKQKNYDIVEMVDSFIMILQDAIKLGEKGKELFSTIQQEVDIVNHYVNIQKYRYRDKFDIEWDVDKALLNNIIPKNILQPIIENAIYHGVSQIEGKGIIKIYIINEEDHILIMVKDNGVGMEPYVIDRLLKGKDNNKHRGSLRSIGLTNIKDRLQYLYGTEYEIKIDSKLDFGTKIIIHIPRTFFENK